jgi:hypothetical protein
MTILRVAMIIHTRELDGRYREGDMVIVRRVIPYAGGVIALMHINTSTQLERCMCHVEGVLVLVWKMRV